MLGGLGDGRGAKYSDYLEWRNKDSQKETPDSILNKKNQPRGVQAFNTLATLFGSDDGSEDTGGKPKLSAFENVNKSLAGETGGEPTIASALFGGSTVTKLGGDIMTTTPIGNTIPPDLEWSSANGMPFYFKDLRDNAFIIFRAYIDGLSDTISPNWNSENYIGRSEPVYTYTNAERELQFNLKLFAQSKKELDMIYDKMNRLTSLCYPEYTSLNIETNQEPGESEPKTVLDKTRMKPPLTKFRLGELFGSSKKEMVGFIKSLSYTFPDESPWEIDKGKRVPKYVQASIGFQVIHSTVPSLDFTRMKDARGKPTTGDSFYGMVDPFPMVEE